MAFKIASGYIDIEATYSRRSLMAAGRRAGRDAARGFNLGFREQIQKKNFDPLSSLNDSAKSSGRVIGNNMAREFNDHFNSRLSKNTQVGVVVNRTLQTGARRVNTRRAADNVAQRFTDDFETSLAARSKGMSKAISKHMFNSPDLQFWMLYAILGALAAALPAIGAAFAVGFTLVGGGAMAALGIAIAAKAPLVRKQFGDLTNNIKNDLKGFAEPFEETLLNTAIHLEGTWNALAPSVERAFSDTAPTIDEFNERALNHLETWDEVIDRMSDAFNELVNEWMGPLGDDMERLRDEFENIFELVAENPEDFVKILNFIMGTLIFIIDLIGDLSMAWVRMSKDWDSENSKIKKGLRELVTPIKLLGTPIALVIGFVAGLVMMFTDLFNLNFAGFQVNFATVFSSLVRFILWPIEVVTILVDALLRLFLGEEWGHATQEGWVNIWQGAGMIIGSFLAYVLTIPVQILKFFERHWELIRVAVWAGVKPWLRPFEWLYDKLIGNSVIPDLVTGILGWFLSMDKGGDSLLSVAVRGFLNIFTGFRKNGISEFSNLRTGVTSQMTRLGNSTIDGLLNMKKRMGNVWTDIKNNGTKAARSLVSGWGTAIAKFGPAVFPGISILVSLVNRGVIGLWDKFAPKLNLKKIGKVPFKGLARGGVLPGYSTYRQGDDQLVPMRRGEGVYVSEAMRDPYERARLFQVNKAAMKGESLSKFRDGRFGGPSPHYQGAYKDQKIMDSALGFARGGIIPTGLSSLIATPWEDFSGRMRDRMSKPMNSLRNQLPDGSNTFMGVPRRILNALIPKVIQVMGSADTKANDALSVGGATGQAADVIKKASSYVGKVSGRPNQFSNAMGMPFGPWCAAFLSEVFRMVNATGSIRGITATNGGAAVATFNSKLKKVPYGQRRPGDLPTYRGSGHINMLQDRETTIGGNESNAVRRQKGYARSATAILRPNYKGGKARGGIMGGTHDVGGLFPNKTAAANLSGKAEVVQTLDQIKAIAAMLESAQGTIHIENLNVEAEKIDEVQKLIDTLNHVRVTSRKGGIGHNGEEI